MPGLMCSQNQFTMWTGYNDCNNLTCWYSLVETLNVWLLATQIRWVFDSLAVGYCLLRYVWVGVSRNELGCDLAEACLWNVNVASRGCGGSDDMYMKNVLVADPRMFAYRSVVDSIPDQNEVYVQLYVDILQVFNGECDWHFAGKSQSRRIVVWCIIWNLQHRSLLVVVLQLLVQLWHEVRGVCPPHLVWRCNLLFSFPLPSSVVHYLPCLPFSSCLPLPSSR